MVRGGTSIGLLSQYAWDPEQFRTGNYLDTMVMIRVDDFMALGGYNEDIRITSWEDFYLWCCVCRQRPTRPPGARDPRAIQPHRSLTPELDRNRCHDGMVSDPRTLSDYRPRLASRMKLVMTLLVRNEEEILEANLDYHLAQGVSFVIVTDHGSTDATPEILEGYEADWRG